MQRLPQLTSLIDLEYLDLESNYLKSSYSNRSSKLYFFQLAIISKVFNSIDINKYKKFQVT